MLVHCYTTWDTAGQLEVFLERGYTFERLLADIGAGSARAEPRDGEGLLMARASDDQPAGAASLRLSGRRRGRTSRRSAMTAPGSCSRS